MKKEEERVSYIVNTIVDDWDSPKLYTEAYVSNLKTQLKKQKEIIDKAKEFVADYKNQWTKTDDVVGDMQMLSNILEDKEVKKWQ